VTLGRDGGGLDPPVVRGRGPPDQVAAGEIVMDVDAVPLAEVEKTWDRADGGRRVVFVP